MTIELDMKKAYDKLEQNSFKVLKDLDFLEKLITWIMECIRATSFLVLVIGISEEPFRLERDIRQNDHISPFFLLLC